MKVRRQCQRCRHPEAECSSATDGRPSYRCTKCNYLWTEGLTAKQRRERDSTAGVSASDSKTQAPKGPDHG